MRPSPSSAIETSTPAIRNLWRSACVLPPFIYLFICPPNLRHSSRARCIQRNLSSKFLCRWIIVGRRGENCNWRTSFVSSPKDKTSKNISASLALTRSVQLFREFRCRQIYSLSRLGVYATLLWDNFLLEFDNKVSNFSLVVSSLYLEISIFDSTSQRSLHRWRDEISDSVLIFFFFK